jgi:hypothetical protein
MINSIQVEATVREIRKINNVLIVNLLNIDQNGWNNYFQAKCYGESSKLNISPDMKLSLEGKIAFDTNGNAYVAIDLPSQVKTTLPQDQSSVKSSVGAVVGETLAFGLRQPKSTVVPYSTSVKSTVGRVGEVVVPELKQNIFEKAMAAMDATKKLASQVIGPEEAENRKFEEKEWAYEMECDDFDRGQYDSDTVPSDWDNIFF